MGAILETLRKALNDREESMREVARATGVDVATISRIANGTRPSVSLATVETLAGYLRLELKPRSRSRRKR
jgi:transcriptional regulator with XRE-family HTH domain